MKASVQVPLSFIIFLIILIIIVALLLIWQFGAFGNVRYVIDNSTTNILKNASEGAFS